MKSKLLTGFAVGIPTGIILNSAFNVFSTRPTAPGGEILIIPFVILFISFGYEIRKEAEQIEGTGQATKQTEQHDITL